MLKEKLTYLVVPQGIVAAQVAFCNLEVLSNNYGTSNLGMFAYPTPGPSIKQEVRVSSSSSKLSTRAVRKNDKGISTVS